MKKLRNVAQCKLCQETIESKHRHDYVKCKCGAVAVDGGEAYLRRAGYPEHILELSYYEDEHGNKTPVRE